MRSPAPAGPPYLDLDELTGVFDLEDAVEAFAVHVSGIHPKVVLRCNDIADEGGAA
jgi:(R,R)-butanediol dehydrogenase/meso-butanediol dehydrogenase/diacetyl reductase/L-iditol 2-dehydrogenase